MQQHADLTIRPDADLRRSLFGDHTLRHPAKQSIVQLMHLLERFATPGGVLLDPFGGSGTSMLAASPCHGGMSVITCELARHFLPLQVQAWQHFQCTLEMQDIWGTPPGSYRSLYGDSRELARVLRCAAAGIPYVSFADVQAAQRAWMTWLLTWLQPMDDVPLAFFLANGPSLLKHLRDLEARYRAADDLDAVASADLIITSPSYGGSEAVDQRTSENATMRRNGGGNRARAGYQQIERMADIGLHARHGGGPHSQLSARQYGYVDTIITSPPYQDSLNAEHAHRANAWLDGDSHQPTFKVMDTRAQSRAAAVRGYQPPADLIITSPPYQDAIHDMTDQRARRIKKAHDNGHEVFPYHVGTYSQVSQINSYGPTAENIGNLKGTKYLAAMALVWQSCAEVLKPGGILCAITRDCVRDGQRVPVGEQNKALLSAAGLTFVEVETWRVPNRSFWRILQQRKHPGSPLIDTEQVWIFRKPTMWEVTR